MKKFDAKLENKKQAARLFITQTQSNRASWQVMNFFLFQAGMVLLKILYALTTHSTGLLLVSADNTFCCIGLGLGLYTIRQTTRRESTRRRYESVAGFANGILLVYVGVLVVLEAVERQIEEGGKVEYAHTFTVCVVGSLGNIAGLLFFPPESRRENHNVQGIYLHIWGNILAFIRVAICTILGKQVPKSIWIAVPGAILVAMIIFISAIPLIIRSMKVLIEENYNNGLLNEITNKIKNINGVRDVEPVKIWTLIGGDIIIGMRIYCSISNIEEINNNCGLIKIARDICIGAGYKRAKIVVEILPSETTHLRRTKSSTSIHIRSAHRRAHSWSRVDLLGALEGA